MHCIGSRKSVISEDENSLSRPIGCTLSMYSIGRKKTKKNIPLVTIFVPPLRIPVQSLELNKMLRGLVPIELVDRISYLRNHIGLLAENNGGSAAPELQRGLEEYLRLLFDLTKKDNGLQELVELKWRNLVDQQGEFCSRNLWFELFSVVHMMAILTMSEANSMLVANYQDTSCENVVSSGNKKNVVELLLKASGYLEFIVRNILTHLPPDIRSELPKDLQEAVLGTISMQALAQGTQIQLGLAIASKNATLPVKRRLACEQLTYLVEAHHCLSTSNYNHEYGKKQLLFIKWKYLEAKAAAYYYNGLIFDKGAEPSCQITAMRCFIAAEELLTGSKKACLTFCLAAPVTRAPAHWGAMKHLNKKIPETRTSKYQLYGHLLEQEKGLKRVPDLPKFQLSLRPEDYDFPPAEDLHVPILSSA